MFHVLPAYVSILGHTVQVVREHMSCKVAQIPIIGKICCYYTTWWQLTRNFGECQLWYFWGGGFPIMTVVVAPKELRIYVFVLNFILHISHSLRYGLIWLHYPNASCLSICCNMMTNIHKELL